MSKLIESKKDRLGKPLYLYECDICGAVEERRRKCHRVICLKCAKANTRKLNEDKKQAELDEAYKSGWNAAVTHCIDTIAGFFGIPKEELAKKIGVQSRRIDITKEKVRCCGEIEDGCGEFDGLNFTYEMWFDVDAYFGTNTRDIDGCWINFYTWYLKNGDVVARYCVETDTEVSEYDWELTEDEKDFFRQKMEQYCMKIYGMSCKEAIEQFEIGGSDE